MFNAARRIVEKLCSRGYRAYFAGGWVRDLLLGRQAKDIDIATDAPPEAVQRIFPSTTAIGVRFGVVQVRTYGRAYEVATFRREGPYLDGRHPSSVCYAGPKEDAKRRDFTINGLFYDPVATTVIDFVGGRKDLESRILRTIGSPRNRFAEDKLRMLRAVRFACSLSFSIDEAAWRAIKRMAGQIRQTSWERIRDEVLQILTGPDRSRGLDLLQESGLLQVILPEVEAMRGVEQPAEYHPEGDVFVHTRLALGLLKKPSAVLALGTLLHDVGKPATYTVQERIRFDGHVEVGAKMAEEICRRLRMSTDDTGAVADLVRNHLRFMHVHEMKESTLQRFLRKPNFADHLELHRVDCLSSHRKLDSYYFCRKKLTELRDEPAHVAPLLRGSDLISLGYEPGPIFSQILRTVEDLQLEKTLRSREEAIEYVLRLFPPEQRR